MFQKGDRVRCIEGFMDGVFPGETGIVLDRLTSDSCRVVWDDYYDKRHNFNGRCEEGHGWSIFDYMLEPEEAADLGELPILDLASIL